MGEVTTKDENLAEDIKEEGEPTLPAGFQVKNKVAPPAPASALPPGFQVKPKAGATPTKRVDVGMGRSAALGALQGVTLGFGDEITAAIDTATSKLPGVRYVVERLAKATGHQGPALDDPNLTYEQRRDAYRNQNKEAQLANPGTYMAGQVAGSIAVPVPGGAAKTVLGMAARGAGVGGVAGLGTSEGKTWEDVLADTLKGAGTGAAVGGGLGAIGRGINVRTSVADPKNLEAAEQLAQLQQVAQTGTPEQKAAVAKFIAEQVTNGGLKNELAGPVVDAARKAGTVMSHSGPVAGGMAALSGHGGPAAYAAMAAPAINAMSKKGAELLVNTVMAARGGNVAAQRIIDGLVATPEGAARVASVLEGSM